MEMHLVVVKPFAGFARGDVIADELRISDILGSEHATKVVRVCLPDTTATAESMSKKEG